MNEKEFEIDLSKIDLNFYKTELKMDNGGCSIVLDIYQQLLTHGTQTGTEGFLVLDVTKQSLVGNLIVGSEYEVNIPNSFLELFSNPANTDKYLLISHNHPENSSFSDDDLCFLSKPAIICISAIAHNGTQYFAKARHKKIYYKEQIKKSYWRIMNSVFLEYYEYVKVGSMTEDEARVMATDEIVKRTASSQDFTYERRLYYE